MGSIHRPEGKEDCRIDEEGPELIISHEHYRYQRRRENAGDNKYNGAYYYSREIVQNIIPRVETDRNWITINIPGEGCNHAIFFVHNNLQPEKYDWIKQYGFQDVLMVCGLWSTYETMEERGWNAMYLPLSIDTEYIKQFKVQEKTKSAAFAGRKTKTIFGNLPEGIDYLHGMRRTQLLKRMAEYEQIYAVGRTAIEARALGCEIMPYDVRFPDPSIWEVRDNKEAAEILQQKLDIIDR